ncbi:histone-lysine N-methyltransferase EHMT2-like [Styela clava]
MEYYFSIEYFNSLHFYLCFEFDPLDSNYLRGKMITDGPINVSFPFRTVRIGTKTSSSLGDNHPFKFDKKRLKFSVNINSESDSAEVVKLVIPCKHITLIKSYLSRGCPVIWLQTTEECTRHIRKLFGLKQSEYPSYYYDPKSKLIAERFIGIVINVNNMGYEDAYNFRLVLQEICQDKNISVDDLHEKISQAECNSMLVKVSEIIDRIQSLLNKIAALPDFDPHKNMHDDLKNSASLLPVSYDNSPTTSSKMKTVQTQNEVDKEKIIKPSLQFPTNVPNSPVSSPQKNMVVSPGTAQRNRARKSIPKSNRSISLESQLDEIRAKAGLSPDAKSVIQVTSQPNKILPDIVENNSTEDATDGNIEPATVPAAVVKKKRPKDPFLWKGRTKRRYKKNSSETRNVYQPPGDNSPKVGETLTTPFSTISATSNFILPNVRDNDTELQSHEQIAGFHSTVEKCKCLEKSPHILHTGVYPIKCMGLDSVDGRLSQCINSVSTPMMMRSSRHSPLLALCDEHRERMLRHECCTGCGMFCAGGTYLICVQSSECPHRFHKDCMLLHHQTKHCLHCGGPMSTVREVTVEPRQEYKLQWLVAGLDANKMEKKRLIANREKTARMGHKSTVETTTILKEEGVVKTLRLGITVHTSQLPPGKDKDIVEDALCNFFETSHKKLKIHPKNVSQVIQQGDLMKLIQFFHEAEEIDFKNLLKNPTNLNRSVMNGNVAIVYLLKLVGVKLNNKDAKGKTALFYAEEREHVRLINFLIENGADISMKDAEGMTCMHQAAKHGRIVSCAALLSNDSNIVNMPDDGGWTPIVWATEHKHTSTAKYLEHFGADVTKTDKERNMCLHWAALSGNLELLIMCLQRRCDFNYRNKHGDTALHIAARQDHADCVLCLANWGVDHTIKNNEGKTALECTFLDTDSQILLKFKHKVAEAMSKPGQQDNQRKSILSADMSKGFEKIPVSCINSVDDAPCPTDAADGFHYVTANVHTSNESIVKNPTNKMQSCYCYNECSDGSCLCGVMSSKCWYNKQGHLIPEFDFVDAPFIVECSETCWCPPSCHNRVVQKGIRYNLQVHRTRTMGWSVRTLDTIPWGAFVCEYVGELISDAEADIREDDSYLFDLENSEAEIFCIDARYYGNVSRFINHLCDPNLMPLRVFIDHHDKRFPRLAYFSTREIKAGEELGFDYGNRFWDIKCRSFNCGCGSQQCKYSEEAYRLRKEEEEKNKIASDSGGLST